MEHRISCPGQPPEFERPGNPRMLHPEFPTHQLPPSSPPQSLVSERRIAESGAFPGSQRYRIYRRQNRAQPVECLVRRLRKHSLKSRGHDAAILPDSANIAPSQSHENLSHVQGRPDIVLTDCERPQEIVQKPAASATAAVQIEQSYNQISNSTLSSSTPHHPHISDLEPERLLSTPAEFHSMVMIPESTATQDNVPLLEIDPKQKLVCEDMDLDEGYGHGTDEFAWTNDGHSRLILRGLADHARKSGALAYRTSSEAAMDCSQVVHKVPRMRRRRHKKNQTRLQVSSSVNTCGTDSQDTHTLKHLVDERDQR